MKKFMTLLMITGLLGFVAEAQAETFNFTGTIKYQKDVVFINFGLLKDAANVRIWTDSFQARVNFDPIMALWTASGDLLAEEDDNPNINPATQTYWDTGFTLPSLGAGNYILTLASYDNFANGTTLAEGFTFDTFNPIPIEAWWVKGTGYYRVWFDGVDKAGVAPLPGTIWLLGAALLAIGGFRRKSGK